MGMRRAQHIAERHAGKHHVGDIAAAAFDQPRVLETGNRLADRKFTHLPPAVRRLACIGMPSKKCPKTLARRAAGPCWSHQVLHRCRGLQSGPTRRYGWRIATKDGCRCPRHSSLPCRPAPTPWPMPARVAANASRSARRPQPPAFAGAAAKPRRGHRRHHRHFASRRGQRRGAEMGERLSALRRMRQGLRLRRQSALPALYGAGRDGAREE